MPVMTDVSASDGAGDGRHANSSVRLFNDSQVFALLQWQFAEITHIHMYV